MPCLFTRVGLAPQSPRKERRLDLKPAPFWAAAAGASEFTGGLLTALGFLNPLGPIGILASMTIAIAKVHWGKPIWVTEGGAEFPVTNSAIALAIALAGPGRYSLDGALGIRLGPTLAALASAGAAMGATHAIVGQEKVNETIGRALRRAS